MLTKRIEEILETAVEVSKNVTVSICYKESVINHMTVKADEIEVMDNLIQISSGYTECSINLEDADNIMTYIEDESEFIDIKYGELYISIGTL